MIKNGMTSATPTAAARSGPGITRDLSFLTACNPAVTASWGVTTNAGNASKCEAESWSPSRVATSKNSVGTGPGQRAVTVIPFGRSSIASASEKLVT